MTRCCGATISLEPSNELRLSLLSARGITYVGDGEPIRTRAYLRYLERGGAHGRALEDWLHAEEEHYRQAQSVRGG
jgi:hypothetical protein